MHERRETAKTAGETFAELWAEECRLARERIAERERLRNAMREAGLTREPVPERAGGING